MKARKHQLYIYYFLGFVQHQNQRYFIEYPQHGIDIHVRYTKNNGTLYLVKLKCTTRLYSPIFDESKKKEVFNAFSPFTDFSEEVIFIFKNSHVSLPLLYPWFLWMLELKSKDCTNDRCYGFIRHYKTLVWH